MEFLEVSAKTGVNVNDAFNKLAEKIMQKRIEKNPAVDPASGISLLSKKNLSEKKKC